jgi:hypothetical protein
MRGLIFLLIILGAPVAMAAPFDHGRGPIQLAAKDFMHPAPKGLVSTERTPKVGNQQAVERVKHAFSDYKILSLRLMESAKGPPVYRVKTLSPEGVVKYVYVDGISGDVFE